MRVVKSLILLFFLVCCHFLWGQSIARWYTSMGDFEVTLREDLMPITTNNFLDLTNSNFYDDLIFHRVIADFMIQDGCPYGTGYGGPGYTIPDEWNPLVNYNEPYVIGMAKTSAPNSAGSQYFITVEPTTWLNGNYAAFGHVTLGSDIVEAISVVPTTGPNGNPPNKPLVDVVIDSIRIMTPQFFAFLPEEDSIYTTAGEPLFFGVFSYETGLSYNWFINDDLQEDFDNLFNVELTVNGWHEIKAVISNGEYDYIKKWWVEITGGTGTENNVEATIILFQNVPNPFNPFTNISFQLNSAGSEITELSIYNVRGQKVTTLVSEPLSTGFHSYVWDGTADDGSAAVGGIYLYRLTSGNYSAVRKTLLLK